MELWVSLFTAGGWTSWPLSVPSNSKDSMILRNNGVRHTQGLDTMGKVWLPKYHAWNMPKERSCSWGKRYVGHACLVGDCLGNWPRWRSLRAKIRLSLG